MAGLTGTLPASLRPWVEHNDESESLQSILGRIYAERGHFRKITEETLQAEIEAQETDIAISDSGEDNEDAEEVKASKSRPEELQAARRDMIGHVAFVTTSLSDEWYAHLD